MVPTLVNSTSTSVAVTGLTTLTGYNFTVYATNEVGMSPGSTPFYASTTGDLLCK